MQIRTRIGGVASQDGGGIVPLVHLLRAVGGGSRGGVTGEGPAAAGSPQSAGLSCW